MGRKDEEDVGLAFPPTEKRASLACAVGAVLLLLFFSVRVVPAGHLGLLVTFGAVSTSPLSSGAHLVNPICNIVLFSTKTRLLDSENFVPTKEGLNVELDVSVLYHIEPTSARAIYTQVGEEYDEIVIRPELSSSVRGLTSEVNARALYTSGRSEIRDKLVDDLRAKLTPRGIVLEDVLLKAIKLPPALSASIEAKTQAEQEAQRMEFVLQTEHQEASRKAIEAGGIAEFQRIVSEGISENLLKWKGIEATEHLAQSDNAKIVVMGNSRESLPVLLSGDEGLSKPSSSLSGKTAKLRGSYLDAAPKDSVKDPLVSDIKAPTASLVSTVASSSSGD